jgi:O-antigen/teichoic acid export membrane protein
MLLLSLLVATLVGVWLVWRTVALQPGTAPTPGLLGRVASYGLRTQAGNTLQALRLRLDQVALVALLSPADLGWYTAAVTAAGLLGPMTQALALVTLPTVASRPGEEAVRRLLGLSRRTLLVLAPGGLVLGLLLPWLLPTLLGARFGASVGPAQILLVGGVFAGLGDVLAEGCRGLNRPEVSVAAEAVGLGVALVLVTALVPRYGLVGAAIASSAAAASIASALAWHVATREGTHWRDLVPGSADLRKVQAALSPAAWRT